MILNVAYAETEYLPTD